MKRLSKNLFLMSGALTGCFLLSLMPIVSPRSDLVEMMSYLFLLIPIMVFSVSGLLNFEINQGISLAGLEVMEAALIYLLPAVIALMVGLWLRHKHQQNHSLGEAAPAHYERWSLRVDQALCVGVVLLGIPLLHLGLSFTGCLCANISNGQPYFGLVPIAPFYFPQTLASVMFLFWPSVSLLLVCRNRPVCRKVVMLLLGIHYVGILLITWQAEWKYVSEVFVATWMVLLICLAVYLGLHVFMWRLLLRNPPPVTQSAD